MKRRREDFEDQTPAGEAFLGDLAYGRCFGKNPTKQDFPAMRDKEGNATNVVAIPLVRVRPRNDEFWSQVKRPRSKHYDNTFLQSTFLEKVHKAVNKDHTIKYNLTVVKIGQDRFDVSKG